MSTVFSVNPGFCATDDEIFGEEEEEFYKSHPGLARERHSSARLYRQSSHLEGKLPTELLSMLPSRAVSFKGNHSHQMQIIPVSNILYLKYSDILSKSNLVTTEFQRSPFSYESLNISIEKIHTNLENDVNILAADSAGAADAVDGESSKYRSIREAKLRRRMSLHATILRHGEAQDLTDDVVQDLVSSPDGQSTLDSNRTTLIRSVPTSLGHKKEIRYVWFLVLSNFDITSSRQRSK